MKTGNLTLNAPVAGHGHSGQKITSWLLRHCLKQSRHSSRGTDFSWSSFMHTLYQDLHLLPYRPTTQIHNLRPSVHSDVAFCVHSATSRRRSIRRKTDRSRSLLWTNRGEKTAVVIRTSRSSTRSFANDLATRLSNRRMHLPGSAPCRARVKSDIGSSNSPTAV